MQKLWNCRSLNPEGGFLIIAMTMQKLEKRKKGKCWLLKTDFTGKDCFACKHMASIDWKLMEIQEKYEKLAKRDWLCGFLIINLSCLLFFHPLHRLFMLGLSFMDMKRKETRLWGKIDYIPSSLFIFIVKSGDFMLKNVFCVGCQVVMSAGISNIFKFLKNSKPREGWKL